MKTITVNKNFGSIMVIVPHQDDEILLTAGVLARAVENCVSVKVVMVTNGDYGSADECVGTARLRETIEGMKILGVKEEDIIFLGYADTGMPEKESFLFNLYMEKDVDTVHPSHCSDHTYGLEEKADYHYKRYQEHAAYTRRSFIGDLEEVLKESKPQNIFTTSLYDCHGDHSGLYLFVLETLRSICSENKDYMPTLYSGIVHSFAGDENWPLRCMRRGQPLDSYCKDKKISIEDYTQPENFESSCVLKWKDRISFPVTEEMKILSLRKNKKAIALSKHVTALKEDAVEFLYSFLKTEELFWQVEWR